MRLRPVIYDRNNNAVIWGLPNISTNPVMRKEDGVLTVSSFTKSIYGGCRLASLSATGKYEAAWELVDFLRYGVEIFDDLNTRVWWGYINSVSINSGPISYGLSLDTMHNSVKVAYSYVAPGSNEVGERKTTAASTNTESISDFGTKQKIISMGGLSDTQGTAIRDTYLTQHKYPTPTIDFSSEGINSISVDIECKGWYDTLDWKYYSNSGTASAATTAQAGSIVATCGQFITTTIITDASGVNSSVYRAEESTGLQEMDDILKTGTSAGERLLANVDYLKNLRIYKDPTDDEYLIDKNGRITTTQGAYIVPHLAKPGAWYRLSNILPLNVNTAKITDPTRIFVDEVEWSNGALLLRPRGIVDAWDLTRIA